ncbi:hypothetical protein SELMODRAFT_417273 [Selaginella moellendorffii]|uniref:N-acetyltransferase domain-containing protein n=1 Tax=Selaginella moellendorffii TaxID=88036 RepID=D8S2P2_SELML|nr:hypothetical protein SELMODRAFT_417273 [Selaginella moellendorffii]
MSAVSSCPGSGIAMVAVMSKPHRCPHIATTGNICVDRGPDSDFEYSTQSYTGYNPYIQARGRVDQLRRLGHSVDKVVAHMMPNLPNVDMERDMESFREFFENPSFRADGLKIYPTLVIRGTGLYELWKTGRYKNYPPEQLVNLVARVLSLVPPWTRVYRIQRDIPMPLVTSGVEKGNLRELALMRMEDLGLKCRDVRTREAGIQDIHNQIKPEEVLLRLRKCGPNATCPELLGRCSIFRELHVYGTAVPVHGRDADKLQHQGYGTLLMEEAERIARKEHRSVKLAVISGVGTRHYYRKLGYELEGPYMTKRL